MRVSSYQKGWLLCELSGNSGQLESICYETKLLIFIRQINIECLMRKKRTCTPQDTPHVTPQVTMEVDVLPIADR